MKPDARTKSWLIEQGFKPWRVEVWNSFSHKKYDLFWIADYLGLPKINSGRKGLIGIQVTGASGRAVHRTDLLSKTPKKQMLKRWLFNGHAFEIHSWQKEAIHGRGKRKDWVLTRERAILSPMGKVSFEEIVDEENKVDTQERENDENAID